MLNKRRRKELIIAILLLVGFGLLFALAGILS